MEQVTCFSQRDPRWENDILGTGKLSIGKAGCLITCMASILVDFGVPTDPHRLNQWLISRGGYKDENLFVFDSVRGLGANLGRYVNCEKVAASVSILYEALEAGYSAVIEVDYKPGGTLNRHWVRLVSLQKGGGWIMDPWEVPGWEMESLDDYLAAGWDVSRGIFALAAYSHNGERVLSFSHLDVSESAVQEHLAVRI
jgi:hypothetical protein